MARRVFISAGTIGFFESVLTAPPGAGNMRANFAEALVVQTDGV